MQTNLVDANGVPITLGATVKLVGTVTSLNPMSLRYREVQVTISHMLPASAGPPNFAAHPTGAEVNVPGYQQVIAVPPGILVVGG